MARPPAPLLLLLLAAAAPSCTPPPPATPALTAPAAVLVLPAATPEPAPPPSSPEEDAEPREIAPAPGASKRAFSIPSLNGVGAAALAPGKVNVVHFWATWCAPCQKAMPRLNAIYQRFKARGLVVVGVSVDDEADGIAAFASNLKLTFPVGWDGGLTIAKQWPLKTMPSTFIVDRSGEIRFTHDGYQDGEDATIEEQVKQLL